MKPGKIGINHQTDTPNIIHASILKPIGPIEPNPPKPKPLPPKSKPPAFASLAAPSPDSLIKSSCPFEVEIISDKFLKDVNCYQYHLQIKYQIYNY